MKTIVLRDTKLTDHAREVVEDAVKASQLGSGLSVILGVFDVAEGHLVQVSRTIPGLNGELIHEWRLVFATYDHDTDIARVVWNNIC